jgi:hypothetical protein
LSLYKARRYGPVIASDTLDEFADSLPVLGGINQLSIFRCRNSVHPLLGLPFTIVARCSTDKAMEKNSAQALDGELVEVSEEIKFDWPEFLPVKRIKAGLTEVALGLTMFAALVASCCSY